MLTPAQALDLIRGRSPALPAREHSLSWRLVGRVLAQDVTAVVDLPPFSTSAMDGFALRAADAGNGALPIAFRVAAGDRPSVLEQGTACGIATGAPMPEGADAVVPIETAVERGGNLLVEAAAPGAFVRPAGQDVRAGERVASTGSHLTPGLLAALASAGVDRVIVSDRPRIAILATGSELAALGRPLEPGQIYESNATAVAAQATRAGAEVVTSATVVDDRAATEAALGAAIARSDVVISSGGVSVGPHDHVKPALAALGVEEVFWRVAHKPGKPLWFGVAASGTLVFGVPGNPVSSLVCFELFVRAALEAMQGAPPAPRATARLAEPVRRLGDREHAMRCALRQGPEGMLLHPQRSQDSHLIVHAGAADAIALVAPGEGEAPAGTLVEYLPL